MQCLSRGKDGRDSRRGDQDSKGQPAVESTKLESAVDDETPKITMEVDEPELRYESRTKFDLQAGNNHGLFEESKENQPEMVTISRK